MTTFTGFPTLGGLMGSMDPEVSVNIESVVDGAAASHGMSVETCTVVTSQCMGEEVYYHYFIAGRFTQANGHALLADDGVAMQARMNSARDEIEKIVRGAGFYKVRRALIAMPKDHKILSGDVEGLRYNKETDLFELEGEG